MKSAVYPGSFDPLTNGHLDIILRAQNFFDKFYVLIGKSYNKAGLFTPEERVELVKKVIGPHSNIIVDSWGGLTVDYVKAHKIDCIVRGVRSSVDFRTEQTLANVNSELFPECETLLMCCRPEFRDVSSQLVKEIAVHKGSLKKFVPVAVEEALVSKLKLK